MSDPSPDAPNRHDWLGLRGRVIAVTGAASGIGLAIAAELAAAGARVALLDRQADALAAVADRLSAQGATVLAQIGRAHV
jgi:NADP-dependent 3-hydroxy acid dehydrogenase YdfG